MSHKSRIARICMVMMALSLLVQWPLARAEIVETDSLTKSGQSEAERARLQSFLERATVKERLQAMGLEGLASSDRVAALSEAEVHALSERMDAMPAGGNLGQMDLILILLIAILVALAI